MCNNTENVIHVVVELMQTATGFRAAIMFYYIRSAAASFHVRRRYKMYHVDVDYDTQNHSVNCEPLVYCNSLITSDSKKV